MSDIDDLMMFFDDESNPDMKVARELMPMIDSHRSGHMHLIESVGKALYGASNGGDDGLELWIDFCIEDDVYEGDDCRREWRSFNKSRLSARTLAQYAKEDSPGEYKRWKTKRVVILINKALDPPISHVNVALVLREWCWLKVICASISKRKWYRFDRHSLIVDEGGKCIRSSMDEVVRFIEKYRVKLSRMSSRATTIDEKKEYEQMITSSVKMCDKLRINAFRNQVASEAAYLLHEDMLGAKLDADMNIIGLDNGVLEVCDGHAHFRPGKLEDYITKSTFVPYIESANKTKAWKDLQLWLDQCFTPAQKTYFIMICCSLLKGGNIDKIVPFFCGKGGNSKSMIKKLIEETLGSYCVNFSNAVFTSQGRGKGPSPETAQAKGSRVAFSQEPEVRQRFFTNLLKSFSGGDSFYARNNRENGGTIKASFINIILCNDIPKMEMDKAMRDRVKCLSFNSLWIRDDDPEQSYPKDPEEQMRQRRFRLDNDFERKIPGMATAFLWLIVDRYHEYSSKGIQEPEDVRINTNKYWNENDSHTLFYNETLMRAADSLVKVEDLHSRYNDWLSEFAPSDRKEDKASFISRMRHVIGEQKDGYFEGIAFK